MNSSVVASAAIRSRDEIKRREVNWNLTKKLAQRRSRAGRWCWLDSWISFASVVSQRRSYGHCLCGFVLHSSWDSSCRRCAVVAAQCRTDTALTLCCSGGGPRQPWSVCFEVSLFCPLFPTRTVCNMLSVLCGR